MPLAGWKQLLAGAPWFRGEGSYPLAAYSEFMPPPRLGLKPYGHFDADVPREEDPWGWPVSEYEEDSGLRPGLENIARQVVGALVHLGHGRPAQGINAYKLADNPYWPPELAEQAGRLGHERYVVLLPLALSLTQDDKGRVRWTLFGGSEQGPARAFWRGFFTAPGKELPEEQALGFLRRLLQSAYGEPDGNLVDLRRAGFRILPEGDDLPFPYWQEDPLPSWTKPLLLGKGESARAVKYLLTFRPFSQVPPSLRQAYLAGNLHLLPFPGSLVFWGAQPFFTLQQELPFALQLPLLPVVDRHQGWHGIRVPQAGWMHEPRPGKPTPTDHTVRNTYKRTHRWAEVHRDEDELALTQREDKLLHVLFSTDADDLGLYDKPMARNVQMWTHDFRLLLDGPRATREQLKSALHVVEQGGLFGYRFQFPAMQVGPYEVYWHRPLVAYGAPEGKGCGVLFDAPTGYLTAYRTDRPNLARPVELWPRLLHRKLHEAAVHLFRHTQDPRPNQTTRNVRKLLDTHQQLGDGPLPHSFARQLLTGPKEETLDAWLASLPERAADWERGDWLAKELRREIGPAGAPLPPALTFEQTARRTFETAYWKTIALLAEGKYLNKNNADCVLDSSTQKLIWHPRRDLDRLGDYLLGYYTKLIAEKRMTGKALAGDLPFVWRTDFEFTWSGGWLSNQEGNAEERDLLVVIPGRDRRRAVIMGDHYDTAYMADRYDKEYGGNGARLAASGADDNHSATATLMLGAPIFLELSRAGRLACDVWLIHLTGEEFPADCLGARHLCQGLVEGTLQMRLPKGRRRDLSGVQVQGVYVLDMVAHNNDHDRDVFQISPGTGRESMWLAYQAHVANAIWNASVPEWNRRPSRRGRGRGRRSPHGGAVPEVALHPHLHGEVRPTYDPRSTLYNTDGQIFSDAGVPVVLFMENYDINRSGYHDTHDTMANIDLDYGAGVAAIAIEAVARAATEDRV